MPFSYFANRIITHNTTSKTVTLVRTAVLFFRHWSNNFGHFVVIVITGSMFYCLKRRKRSQLQGHQDQNDNLEMFPYSTVTGEQ